MCLQESFVLLLGVALFVCVYSLSLTRCIMYINFSHIVLMNILLVGCTGFLGKSLIHYLITNTRHTIIIVLRPKHNLSIDERLQDILNLSLIHI